MGTPSEPDHDAMLAGMEDLVAAMKHRKPAAAVAGSLVNETALEAEASPSRTSNDLLAAAPWEALGFGGVVDAVERARVYEAMFQVPAQEQKLGRYVVLGALGRGGMGVVLEAFDRTLDRRVAIKVLHEELDEGQTQRLLREARALAKLSHPNVVQVYEAGEVDGQAFVAMELVRGQMLGAWMRQEPRPDWRACVEMFVQLGAGLAAAHERGLVHRDFKPGNAIVDDEGRPRVLDFGLARKTEREQDGEPSRSPRARAADDTSALDAPLTRAGTVMGTPAYMPPEQMKGHEADARSDQFSFCVSLYEAVYGERPFAGRSLEALMTSIVGGVVRPVPKGSKIPAKLRAALLRGLAFDPAQRWPSMDALLGELRRLVAPRTRRGLVLGLTVGLVGMGAALGVPHHLELQARCSGARALLDGVWDEARRREVEDAVLGTERSYAADTWARIEPQLDEYAQAWVTKHTEVCEATSIRGEQTEEAMELRMGCLHERKVALGAAVTVLVDADATVVERAVQLVEALPSMDRCDDLERLDHMRQRVPPPEDPQAEAEVEALREQLAGIEAEHEASRHADALEHVEPVVQRAEALGYGPLLAEALVRRGYARRENDMLVEAEQDLEQAFVLAAEHGHDAVAAKAVTGLTWVVGVRQGRHEPGLGWGRTAVALSRGPEVEATARAGSLINMGVLLQRQGALDDALIHYQRALVIQQHALGDHHSVVAGTLDNIGNALQEQGKLDEALTHLQHALAIREQALGGHHSKVASTLDNIGVVLQEQGKLDEALAHHQRALVIKERALGSHHSSVAGTLTNIGVVLQEQGELDEALTYQQRALTIHEQALGDDHPTVAGALGNLGIVLQAQGKLDEALTYQQRALAIQERALGEHHPKVADTLSNIGIVLHMQGELDEALTHQQRALASYEQAFGGHHSRVATALSNLGIVLQEQGKLDEALAHHQRALAIAEQALGNDHFGVAVTLGNIGLVLKAQGKLDEASTYYRRALAIFERALGSHHPSVADTLSNIGLVLKAQGKLDEALTHYQQALAIDERALGNDHFKVASTLSNIGVVLELQGKLDEASTHYQRALAIAERALGSDHPDLAHPLVGLAEVALAQRELDTARSHAERAVSICEAGDAPPPLLAAARFALARVLWNDRAERKRAHALAQQARDALAAPEGPSASALDVAELDAWLAGHRVRGG